jgi:hypothetical protein
VKFASGAMDNKNRLVLGRSYVENHLNASLMVDLSDCMRSRSRPADQRTRIFGRKFLIVRGAALSQLVIV